MFTLQDDRRTKTKNDSKSEKGEEEVIKENDWFESEEEGDVWELDLDEVFSPCMTSTPISSPTYGRGLHQRPMMCPSNAHNEERMEHVWANAEVNSVEDLSEDEEAEWDKLMEI